MAADIVIATSLQRQHINNIDYWQLHRNCNAKVYRETVSYNTRNVLHIVRTVYPLLLCR